MATYVRDKRNTIKQGKLVIPSLPEGEGDPIGVDEVGQLVKIAAVTPPDPEPVEAGDVEFTSAAGLTSTDVAAALDELKALIDGLGG